MLPTLSCLSVRTSPAVCLHLWRSDRYQRISPLHLSFRQPLLASRHAVRQAVPRLSRGISQNACVSAYVRFKPNDSAQRSGPSYYRGCWHEVSRPFLWVWSLCSYTLTAVYTPRGFILHAALLRHAFAHCGRFVTAASRRSPNSVSVSMWRAMLSHPLPVNGLVSRYLTNYLIGRSPLSRRQAFDLSITSGITQSFPWLSPTLRYVRNALLTLSPLYSWIAPLSRSTCMF